MLYFQIKDYNEFRDIYGSRNSARGSIQNKVLLSFWMTRMKRDHNGIASKIRTMNDLFETILDCLNQHLPENYRDCGQVSFDLNDQHYIFYCSKYTSVVDRDTQSQSQFCTDPKCITVQDRKSKKWVNVKLSKIFLDACQTNKTVIGEPTTIYCAEEIQHRWEAYTSKLLNVIQLHIDKDFKSIYTASKQAGNNGSCMNDKRQYHFYEKAVNASAAYITNTETGLILARCILFHGVKLIGTDKTINYAERQYAGTDKADIYKHILIQKLIDAGAIDYYKKIGAGCSDVNAILDKNGRSLKNTRVSIPCHLQNGDWLSYQDTFKYYDPDKNEAYNYMPEMKTYKELGHTIDHYEW